MVVVEDWEGGRGRGLFSCLLGCEGFAAPGKDEMERGRRGVVAPVGEGGVAPDAGVRLVRLVRGGRERSGKVVEEVVVNVCDGGRRVLVLDRVVTEDLARVCRIPGPASEL